MYGKALGYQTIAEGVETTEQLEYQSNKDAMRYKAIFTLNHFAEDLNSLEINKDCLISFISTIPQFFNILCDKRDFFLNTMQWQNIYISRDNAQTHQSHFQNILVYCCYFNFFALYF
jgi:hypothetical protein